MIIGSDFPGWMMRTVQLLGEEKCRRLMDAHVLVAGMGGVGAMAAEMLVTGRDREDHYCRQRHGTAVQYQQADGGAALDRRKPKVGGDEGAAAGYQSGS
jgi:hypothetical protein